MSAGLKRWMEVGYSVEMAMTFEVISTAFGQVDRAFGGLSRPCFVSVSHETQAAFCGYEGGGLKPLPRAAPLSHVPFHVLLLCSV